MGKTRGYVYHHKDTLCSRRFVYPPLFADNKNPINCKICLAVDEYNKTGIYRKDYHRPRGKK